jgi:hypothetical protein
MAITFTLVQGCLDTFNDAAGGWQIEAGKIMEALPSLIPELPKQVGNYSTILRTSCGTTPQNTAMVWSTLFFTGSTPPQNMTLHGSHDYESGDEIGSVSAASSTYAAYIGQQFTRTGNTLTIA